jgi:hypothetical protein
MIKRLLLTGFLLQFAASDIASAPGKGLTLADDLCARAMESPGNSSPSTAAAAPQTYYSVLKRVAIASGELVILIADSYMTTEDPYVGAAWWSPRARLGIVLQSSPDYRQVTKLLEIQGNPWEGCLAVVETATPEELVISCELGGKQAAKRVRIRVDAARTTASVRSFEPKPIGFVQ